MTFVWQTTVLNPCERCGRKPTKFVAVFTDCEEVTSVDCKCGNIILNEYNHPPDVEWQQRTAHCAKLNAALDRIFAFAGMSADVLRTVIAEAKAGVRQ